MKIAYIVEPRQVIGGGVVAAINLCKGLKLYNNIDAAIFGIYTESQKETDVSVFYSKASKPLSVLYIRELFHFLHCERPLFVHCLGLYTVLLSIIYRLLTCQKFKIICTVHRITTNIRHPILSKIVTRLITHHIDYATFLTPFQEQHYRNVLGYRPKESMVIPNVIFTGEQTKEEGKILHEKYRTQLHADWVVSYVGRLNEGKNIDDIIRIVSHLNKRGYNVGAIIVGGCSYDYMQKLCSIINEEQIHQKIHFVGFVNNPTSYIAAGDFILTTTRSEALPNLMVEAFAMGRTFIASDIPQLKDLIDNGKSGYRCPLNDLSKFEDTIINCINHPEVMRRIEHTAQQHYADSYAPQLVTAKYNEIYNKI